MLNPGLWPHKTMFVSTVPDTPIVGVVSTTATSVTLSCTDPSGSAVISHVLHWQEDGLVRCSDEDEGTTAFHIDESGLTTLNGLEEGMTYKMSVTAINVVGSSEVSETFIVVTEEAGRILPSSLFLSLSNFSHSSFWPTHRTRQHSHH